MQIIKFLAIILEFVVQIGEKIVDIFQLGVGSHVNMLIDMNFDAGGAEWEEAARAVAEISEILISMEGALDPGQFQAMLAIILQQTCLHI